MSLSALIAHRTVRTFAPRPVPAELVRGIVSAASWTGSARNRQPWRFVAVQDPDRRAALAACGAYAGHLTDAPLVLVVLGPTERSLDTEFDLGRIAQSLTLACSEEGLGSCIVSLYPEQNAAAAASIVDAPLGFTARHAIAIGYPAPRPSGPLAIPTGRLSIEDLLRFA